MGKAFRIIFYLRRTPLLRRTLPCSRNLPIFVLRSRRSKNPHLLSSEPKIDEFSIFNLRFSAPKIEDPPSSIFGPEEWVEDRTKEGGGTSSKMGGFFEDWGGSSIFLVRRTKNSLSSTFSALRTMNTSYIFLGRKNERKTPLVLVLPTSSPKRLHHGAHGYLRPNLRL